MEGGYARPTLPHGGRLRSPDSAAWRAATLARLCRMEGGYARPTLPHGGRLRSPDSAAWRAATLARLCRMEGGYARPTLPHGGRLRSPDSAAWRAATLARLCRMEGGYARPTLPHGGRLRSPDSAAWRAATLARLCRMEGGYARPTLPHGGRLRSPDSAAWRAATLARLCRTARGTASRIRAGIGTRGTCHRMPCALRQPTVPRAVVTDRGGPLRTGWLWGGNRRSTLACTVASRSPNRATVIGTRSRSLVTIARGGHHGGDTDAAGGRPEHVLGWPPDRIGPPPRSHRRGALVRDGGTRVPPLEAYQAALASVGCTPDRRSTGVTGNAGPAGARRAADGVGRTVSWPTLTRQLLPRRAAKARSAPGTSVGGFSRATASAPSPAPGAAAPPPAERSRAVGTGSPPRPRVRRRSLGHTPAATRCRPRGTGQADEDAHREPSGRRDKAELGSAVQVGQERLERLVPILVGGRTRGCSPDRDDTRPGRRVRQSPSTRSADSTSSAISAWSSLAIRSTASASA